MDGNFRALEIYLECFSGKIEVIRKFSVSGLRDGFELFM